MKDKGNDDRDVISLALLRQGALSSPEAVAELVALNYIMKKLLFSRINTGEAVTGFDEEAGVEEISSED